MMTQIVTRRNVFLLGLAGFLFGLAMSEFVISISQFFLAANWLISKNFKVKWERIKSNPVVWVIWFFYLLHAFGMVHTAHFELGIDELRIKLPFLLIPLFVVSESPISRKELMGLLFILVIAILISTGFGIVHNLQHQFDVGYDVRDSSMFVPHIRLSLMIDLVIVWLLSLSIQAQVKNWVKIVLWVTVMYLLYYLFQLQSLTGLVILPFALFFAFVFSRIESKIISKIRIVIAGFGVVFIIFSSIYIYQIAKPFIEFKAHSVEELDRNTSNEYLYLHKLDNLMLENGNQVWIYISDPETRPEWNKMSDIDFDGIGNTGESIRPTLYRYLTSMGLRKDSVGMQSLTPEDVAAIENGEPNIRFVNETSIEKRIYQTIWELNNYQNKAGSYEGHSVAQRFEFWRIGWQAFKLNPIFGSGTGDVRDVMDSQYLKNNSILSAKKQLKPHNQFITTSISLGLIGLFSLIFCFAIVLAQARDKPAHMAFLVILLLSFISEDTIDAQVGASIFIGFYALFFCQPKVTEITQEDINSL